MEVIKTVLELKSWVAKRKSVSAEITVVPTMGYLHAGHLSLINVAKNFGGAVITTIFVNPTQFAPSEDLEKYPRNIAQDTKLAKESGADVLFIPEVSEVYPTGFSTSIDVGDLTKIFEGEIRPTHFSGVATIVAKLLHLTQADKAIFGQKDYQQTLVVKKLVKDLNIPCEIIISPIVRELDGLAMSSRNVYLTENSRSLAVGISKCLFKTKALIENGERNRRVIEKYFREQLIELGIDQIDYASAVAADDLGASDHYKNTQKIVLLVAAKVGGVRLLDNAIVECPR